MNWILVSETKLASELNGNLKKAGIILAKAGFVKKKKWNPATKSCLSFVDTRAAQLSLAEIQGIGVFGGPPAGEKTRAVRKAESAPTYQELVTALESANKLIEDLKEENQQLRSYIPNNGIGDRAKKALAVAGKAMTIYGG